MEYNFGCWYLPFESWLGFRMDPIKDCEKLFYNYFSQEYSAARH